MSAARKRAGQPARLRSLLPASRVLHSNPRAQGTNPRALGVNPRARAANLRVWQLNPKALGQDCRQPTKQPWARRGILAWLADRSVIDDAIDAKNGDVAAAVGCHPRDVPRLLAELERKGVLVRSDTAGGRGRGLRISILNRVGLFELLARCTPRRAKVFSWAEEYARRRKAVFAPTQELTKPWQFPHSPFTGIRSASSGAAPAAVAAHQNLNFGVAEASGSANTTTAAPCGREKTALRAPPSVAAVVELARRVRKTREPEKFRRGMLMAIRWALWARGAPRSRATSAAGWLVKRAAGAAQGVLRHELERLLRTALTYPAGELAELGRSLKAWQRTTTPPTSAAQAKSFFRPAAGAEVQLPLWVQEFARRGAG